MNDAIFFFVLLMWFCVFLFFSAIVLFLKSWLVVACMVDLCAKKEDEFTNKNAWLALLIVSISFPFEIVIPMVYFFKYKPNLKFWKK